MPFLRDLLLLELGEGRSLRPSVRVEPGHDPRLAPALKEFPQPPTGHAPPRGDLRKGIAVPGALGLEDQVGDPTVGELRHTPESRWGKPFEAPNGGPRDPGSSMDRFEGREVDPPARVEGPSDPSDLELLPPRVSQGEAAPKGGTETRIPPMTPLSSRGQGRN